MRSREGRSFTAAPPAAEGRRRWDAAGGVLASVSALGAAELVAAVLPGASRVVATVGEALIDLVPGQIAILSIAILGLAGKPALVGGIIGVCLAAGAVAGVLAGRRFIWGAVIVWGFGAAGAAATFSAPAASIQTALASAAGAAVGTAVLWHAVRIAAPPPAVAATAEKQAPSAIRLPSGPREFDRRRFMQLAAGSGAIAVVGAAAGSLSGRADDGLPAADQASGDFAMLRASARQRPAPPADPAAEIEGLSSLFTPNESFYRIDTALTVPRVNLSTWRLTVTGDVERPFELSYADLLNLPLVEDDVTLCCVSNEVGGDLIGNARWLGVPLSRLLDRAAPGPGATQIVGRSVDGWTAGFPTALAYEHAALVAVGMNGEPLPRRHGFPARLVVPGLYGYVSATKWLSEIELTSWDAFDAYWIPRGWSKEGPVKTQSRIDRPRHRESIPAGETAVAGVAWAQPRGISLVEVQIDSEPWIQADLGPSLSDSTWVQWWLPWDPAPGRHLLRVRATDGDGQTQTDTHSPPAPDGATGHHVIEVDVSPSD